MQRFFTIVTVFLLILSFALGAYAEDMTAEEAAESLTEADTASADELVTDTNNAAETETDELSALLDVATPEQVELVKQYILYGIKSLPVSERVKLFLLDHLDVIMWLIAAIAVVVFAVSNRLASKKHTDEANKMTDNAIEIAERGQNAMDEAQKKMDAFAAETAKIIENVLEEAKKRLDDNALEVRKYVDGAAEKIEAAEKSASDVMQQASERDTAMTEAVLLTNQIIAYLIEKSYLPEVEKDSMAAISAKIADQIEKAKKSKEVENGGEN